MRVMACSRSCCRTSSLSCNGVAIALLRAQLPLEVGDVHLGFGLDHAGRQLEGIGLDQACDDDLMQRSARLTLGDFLLVLAQLLRKLRQGVNSAHFLGELVAQCREDAFLDLIDYNMEDDFLTSHRPILIGFGKLHRNLPDFPFAHADETAARRSRSPTFDPTTRA